MRVVDCHDSRVRHLPGFVYAGRPSVLGNPWVIGVHGTRREVIDRYRVWLAGKLKEGDAVVRAALLSLTEDSVLGCWCVSDDAPESSTVRGSEVCHCQVIAKAVQWVRISAAV